MFQCPTCHKSFKSLNGQIMHSRAVHIDFPCSVCNKRFKSERGLEQHCNAVNHLQYKEEEYEDESSEESSVESSEGSSWRPNPPIDTAGDWVHPYEFKGRKSFGYFKCSSCLKTWISAHSFPQFKQGCKKCNIEDVPIFLWQNAENEDRRDRYFKLEELNKPHDQHRCEACRRGLCLA